MLNENTPDWIICTGKHLFASRHRNSHTTQSVSLEILLPEHLCNCDTHAGFERWLFGSSLGLDWVSRLYTQYRISVWGEEMPAPSPSTVWGQQVEGHCFQGEPSPDPKMPPSRTTRNKHLLSHPPTAWCSVLEPKQTKTTDCSKCPVEHWVKTGPGSPAGLTARDTDY